MWQGLLVERRRLKHVHLIIHTEDDAHARHRAERCECRVGLIIFYLAVIVEVETDCGATNAGTTVAHQNRANTELKETILSKGLRPFEHDVGTKLLCRDKEVGQTLRVTLLYLFTEELHRGLVYHMKGCIRAERFSQIVVPIKDETLRIQTGAATKW